MATTAGGRGPPAAASIIAAAARPATVDYLTSLVRPHHRFVLIGDSSHGTAEQYALRADLSLALLNGGGGGGCPFHSLVYESDWPEAFATNLWVRGCAGALTAGSARDALQPYRASRFPTWMWANEQFASFCTRLRELNAALAPAERKGVYGCDVYSFDTSMASLIAFYQAAGDKAGAAAARRGYACFADHGGGDSNRYAVFSLRAGRGAAKLKHSPSSWKRRRRRARKRRRRRGRLKRERRRRQEVVVAQQPPPLNPPPRPSWPGSAV